MNKLEEKKAKIVKNIERVTSELEQFNVNKDDIDNQITVQQDNVKALTIERVGLTASEIPVELPSEGVALPPTIADIPQAMNLAASIVNQAEAKITAALTKRIKPATLLSDEENDKANQAAIDTAD